MSLTKKQKPYPHWEYIDQKTQDRLRVVPERGGLVTEWRCNGKEKFYFDSERFIDTSLSVRGGVPVLFPICGNLPGDLLTLPSGNFTLKQHGFARNASWDIRMTKANDGLILSLKDNPETYKSYPFLFLVEMKILIESMSLKFDIAIHNRDSKDMPFCFGLHPYFLISDLSKLSIKGLSEKCTDQSKNLQVSTRGQLNSLDKGVDFLSKGSRDIIRLVDSEAKTSLEILHFPPMDLTVVWTQPPRNMICIEPWTSPRNGLVTGERLINLKPGTCSNLRCKYIVKD